MNPLRTRLERWSDGVLDGIRKCPAMYGQPDAVEAQALLLVIVRELIATPAKPGEIERATLRAWRSHVQRSLGVDRADTLARCLEERHPNEPDAQFRTLLEVLDPFVRERLGALSPTSPFASNDLALVVRLHKNRPLPTAARVGALLGLVGQVLRSVVRQDARRGRLRREVEDAITIRPAGSVEIIPENGIGAQIVMPLSWPQPSQTTLPEVDDVGRRVRETFDRFVSVTAWAASNGDPLERLVEAVPDPAARTRMALDAVRLVPPASGAIEAIEIGGREIQRYVPVSLRSDARGRLVDALRQVQPPTSFDAVGAMRMIDLDDGRLRLRTRDSAESIEVWLPDVGAAEDVATLLGREVRVVGQRFSRPTGSAFVVADAIEPREDDTDQRD